MFTKAISPTLYLVTLAISCIMNHPCFSQGSSVNDIHSSIKDINNHFDFPRRYYMGDHIPLDQIQFSDTKNNNDSPIKLSDYKGQLIILDFWNKNCSSCIAGFPKLEALQKELGDKVKVLLISTDKQQDITKLLLRSTIVKNTTLPMIFGDTLLSNIMFPHFSVPYAVWIDSTGKVVATTESSETTKENILTYLNTGQLNIMIRNDVMDGSLNGTHTPMLKFKNGALLNHLIYLAPIFSNNLPEEVPRQFKNLQEKIQTTNYYSAFYNDIREYRFGIGIFYLKDPTGQKNGISIRNFDLSLLMLYAYSDGPEMPPTPKFVIDTSAKKFIQEKDRQTNEVRYQSFYLYNYECVSPDFSIENVKYTLRKDIERCFGLRAEYKMRSMPCVILKKLSNFKELKTSMEDSLEEYISTDYLTHFKNTSLNLFITRFSLANSASSLPYIIDETMLSGASILDIKLNTSDLRLTNENLVKINKQLSGHGLVFFKTMRYIPILEISKY